MFDSSAIPPSRPPRTSGTQFTREDRTTSDSEAPVDRDTVRIRRLPIALESNFRIGNLNVEQIQNHLRRLSNLNIAEQNIVNGNLLTLNITVEQYHNALFNRNVRQIEPSGIHVPNGADIGDEDRHALENGALRFEDLSPEVRERLVVQLGNNDVIRPNREGALLDAVQHPFLPDGRVFDYTLIPEHGYHRIGIPAVLNTRNSSNITQDVDPNSLRIIYFRRPGSQAVERGYYFQVSERNTGTNSIGYNGAIVPISQRTLIQTANEAYIVNPSGNGQ